MIHITVYLPWPLVSLCRQQFTVHFYFPSVVTQKSRLPHIGICCAGLGLEHAQSRRAPLRFCRISGRRPKVRRVLPYWPLQVRDMARTQEAYRISPQDRRGYIRYCLLFYQETLFLLQAIVEKQLIFILVKYLVFPFRKIS